MPKIMDMIKNEKVEWKKLGEVCEIITDYVAAGSFKAIAENVNYLDEPDFAQLIRTKDIKSEFKNIDSFVYVDEHAFNYLYRVNLNRECLILPNIGNCGEIYHLVPNKLPYKNNVLGPNAILIQSKSHNMRFLYHLFLEKDFQNELYKITSRTGQGKFNKTDLKQIYLPIPSLEVQEKIVKILDKFTKYVTELQAELQARTKQYSYYRDMLLSEENLNKLSKKLNRLEDKKYELRITTLGEIVNIIVGGDVPKNNFSKRKTKDFSIPIYSNGIAEKALYGYTNQIRVDKPSVTVSARGTIGYVCLREEPYYPIVRLLCLLPKQDIAVKYLYYFLQNSKINHIHTGIPSLTTDMVKNIKLYLPPISIQNKIVEILDKFQSLLSDTQGLLPQEIEQRQKQYEFYREKLLTFGVNCVRERERERERG